MGRYWLEVRGQHVLLAEAFQHSVEGTFVHKNATMGPRVTDALSRATTMEQIAEPPGYNGPTQNTEFARAGCYQTNRRTGYEEPSKDTGHAFRTTPQCGDGNQQLL